MNPKGAARIAFGHYKAWQVGIHGYSEPHEALIQVGLVRVHRDYNRDMMRTGDAIDEGFFGINQHHGYGHPVNDIHTASAGCLVGRTRREHQSFMQIVKQDARYLNNREFIFSTTTPFPVEDDLLLLFSSFASFASSRFNNSIFFQWERSILDGSKI